MAPITAPPAPQEGPVSSTLSAFTAPVAIPDAIEMTPEYERVVSLIQSGAPMVFVTGGAGTGKSTLIDVIRTRCRKRMAVVAFTGVAALNVRCSTIHSFFRLPPRICDHSEIRSVEDRRMYRELELLVIDEVSMVRGDLMDNIDRFLRVNRSSQVPFGGVQVVLIGDPFQLPPVVTRRDREVLELAGYTHLHFFDALCLRDARFEMVELTAQYRQSDAELVRLLNMLRDGESKSHAVREINVRAGFCDSRQGVVTLTTTNADADALNSTRLSGIGSPVHRFRGRVTGAMETTESRLPSPLNLDLKVGAQVMFTRNEWPQWVNGTVGVVTGFSGDGIQVRIPLPSDAGRIVTVHPVTWSEYRQEWDPRLKRIVTVETGTFTQYPLTLAWALTIHKSQGKTLDAARIDLGRGAFAHGQAYVALSRCRSLSDIELVRPLRESDIICDAAVREFYAGLSAPDVDTTHRRTA